MPKIIRSTGVNVQRAHPAAAPRKAQAKPDALLPAQSARMQDIQAEAEKIQASAEIIVDEILSRARNDADNMLVNARYETMRVLQDAVQDGRDQGLASIRREWDALRGEIEAELAAAQEAMNAERRQILKDVEKDVLALVFDIADKVLAVQMDRSDAWVEGMVREALMQMEGEDSAVMKVAAAQRSRVALVAERLLSEAGRPLSQLSITADGALPPGGCVIETDRGFVHNGAEEKMDRLKALLTDDV